MNGPVTLAPRTLQVAGLVLLVGAAVFWAATGRESLLIMSAAMTLIAGGAFRGIQLSLKEAEKADPPPES